MMQRIYFLAAAAPLVVAVLVGSGPANAGGTSPFGCSVGEPAAAAQAVRTGGEPAEASGAADGAGPAAGDSASYGY